MNRIHFSDAWYSILVIVLLSIVSSSGLVLSSSIVSADNDSAVDVINITVPVSCTLAGTGMTSHNATISNGLYTADIGSTILHAFCNDNNGLAIYAAGFTGDEVGGTNSNKLVGTATQSNFAIVTGLATTTSNPDVSNWAMKLAITQDSGDTTGTNAFTIDSAPNVENPSQAEQGTTAASFTQYHVVPNEYVKVAHKNSGTDMTNNTGGIKLTTTYAAYISKTQPADTYSGQVIYTLVHPSSHAAPVYLNPNADNISEVNYMQQFAIVSDENRQAIIDSMTPEQQYTVLDSRDGKSYTIAKYAVPAANLPLAVDYMQSCYERWYYGYYNVNNCDATIYAQLPSDWKAYIDSFNPSNETFDESLRPVAYDIWMTKNLDLDIDSTITYTNEDTDIGYNTTTGTYDTASWTPTSSTMTSSNANWMMSPFTPESYDPGDLYWNGTMVSDYSDWYAYYDSCSQDQNTGVISCNESLNPLSTYAGSTGIAQYHLGNYYNWTAALAMNDSSSKTSITEVIEQSICPAGWTLPRVSYFEDSFYTLWNRYGLDKSSYNDADNDNVYDESEDALWTNPLYYSVNGQFNGVLGDIGGYGFYWSAIAGGQYSAQGAEYNVAGYASSTHSARRDIDRSVRCVARPVVGSMSRSGDLVPGTK